MNKNHISKRLTRREALKLGAGAVVGVAAFGRVSALASEPISSMNQSQNIQNFGLLPENGELKVDFSYAFATPHRITIGRPDASDRTLMDLEPEFVRMSWTYDNLALPNFPPLALRIPQTMWKIKIIPQIDEKPLEQSSWNRFEKFLPGFEKVCTNPSGEVKLEALNGMDAALIRVSLKNTDTHPHQFVVRLNSEKWGETPAWVDPTQYIGDHILAGWNDRADRVLVLGIGAEKYSLHPDGLAPAKNSIVMVWNLEPGEKRQGWIVRPHHGYTSDLQILRNTDWAKELEKGKKEWVDLINRATQMMIPDSGVSNAYKACFADLFIMREPLSDGRMIAVPGTESYRAGNSGEPLLTAIALDQNGLHDEALNGASISIEMQEPDGNWADARGWGHTGWGVPGFKSWFIMNHYRVTGDKSFLAEVYPRMLASSRFQEKQRVRSRNAAGEKSMTYGLMPRGFGDCGLMNDDDFYGVFIPHNIYSVYADRCTLEAAEILGKTNDIQELKKLFETAQKDLLTAMDRGAIQEKDYRWISGVPGKTTGSSWGTLYAVFPCQIMTPDDELIAGTLKRIEANISKGGQPIHNGWMTDGSWVAATLDNVAEVKLVQGDGDAAVRYLYSSLNHGTPLLSWCEERGQESGTTKTSGDRQHLWTPVAVVRLLRDMFVMESNDELNLALGTAREWLASGEKVGISGAYTYFGKVSYHMQYDSTGSKVTGEIIFDENPSAAWANLYIRLPEGLKIKSVNQKSKAKVLPDGSGLRWEKPCGTIRFEVTIRS